MTDKYYSLPLILTLIMILFGCATTKNESTETSVDSTSQVEKAKSAFNQKNYSLAAKLLEPLAKQGNGYAQYALGYMYYNGMGVPRNYSLAAHWLKTAAANGNQNAKEALSRLSLPDDTVIDLRDKKEPASSSAMELDAETVSGTNDGSLSVDTVVTPDISSGTATESPVDEPASAEPSIKHKEITKQAEATDLNDAASYTDDEKWIINQPDNSYTIQLMVLTNESAMQRFIIENNLQVSTVYYRTQRDGQTYYTLVQGSFESHSAAKEGVSELPPGLRTAEPWIRPIAGIKKILSSR